MFDLFVDLVRCEDCDGIIMAVMPSQELDSEEYNAKRATHDATRCPEKSGYVAEA